MQGVGRIKIAEQIQWYKDFSRKQGNGAGNFACNAIARKIARAYSASVESG